MFNSFKKLVLKFPSINLSLSRINFCVKDPSTMNRDVKNVPSKTFIGSEVVPNCANPLFTVVVILSYIENIKSVSSCVPTQTTPGCNVNVGLLVLVAI